jgi:hypothetical protein
MPAPKETEGRDVADDFHQVLVLASTVAHVGSIPLYGEVYRVTGVAAVILSAASVAPASTTPSTIFGEFAEYQSNLMGGVASLLGSGDFYFCVEGETRHLSASTSSLYDDKQSPVDVFEWNSHMLSRLPGSVSSPFCRPLIRGFVGIDQPNGMALISRCGKGHAGTRFNARGVNDDGHVANFVETESIILADDGSTLSSFVQVRGSVPVFWEQRSTTVGAGPPALSRTADASLPAFSEHMLYLRQRYGDVAAVNLLAFKEREAVLSAAYSACVRGLLADESADMSDHLHYYTYDAAARCPTMRMEELTSLMTQLHAQFEVVGFFQGSLRDTGNPLRRQDGVFRTNCLDCLDRTNLFQTAAAWHAMTTVHKTLSKGRRATHLRLWEENGAALSVAYAGASTSKTRYSAAKKRAGRAGFMSALVDDAISGAQRLYSSAFLDSARQLAMDCVLYGTAAELHALHGDRGTTTSDVTLFVGTWNVNGQPPAAHDDLADWLHPSSGADLYLIGFQEIVDLTAESVLLSASKENSRLWERRILRCLPGYATVQRFQLVGVALILLARRSAMSLISHVTHATVRTGFGGYTANKGSVVVSATLGNRVRLTMVASHMAAGQSHVEERNADVATTLEAVPSLRTDDAAIWLGDFNYRVNISRAEALRLTAARDLDPLLRLDQLRHEQREGRTFPGFSEQPLTFLPTYKYNLNSDTYDDSEKERIPAWTDRILFRGVVEPLRYARAELRSSDHKPVYAMFRVPLAGGGEKRGAERAGKSRVQRLLVAEAMPSSPSHSLSSSRAGEDDAGDSSSSASAGFSSDESSEEGTPLPPTLPPKKPTTTPSLDALINFGDEPTAPPPNPTPLSSSSSSLSLSPRPVDPADPTSWLATAADVQRFDAVVTRAIGDAGSLDGEQVRDLLGKSGLPRADLSTLWRLTASPAGVVPRRRFIAALWMANARLRGAPTLPADPREIHALFSSVDAALDG